MNTQTKGLVIREQTIGESDRLVTLLTADYGLIRAFVRGAKRVKSRTASSTSLFSFAEFSIYRGRDAYIIDSASSIEVFFDLRLDLERLAAAQYFAQLALNLAEEEQPAPLTLQLMLNSLHTLCLGKRSVAQIKAVFEWRIMSLCGYMPQILACKSCSEYETDTMFFDIDEGCIYCKKCGKKGAVELPCDVIKAVRFACLTEPAKIFSFKLPHDSLMLFSSLSERYVMSRIGHRLSTLEFYKSIAAQGVTDIADND